jgi:hypothetical protein
MDQYFNRFVEKFKIWKNIKWLWKYCIYIECKVIYTIVQNSIFIINWRELKKKWNEKFLKEMKWNELKFQVTQLSKNKKLTKKNHL